MDKIRVILIEDNQSQAYLVKILLEKRGFEVVNIYDGAEGFDYLKNKSKPKDVVLLDYHLPHMNGLEILEKLKTLYQSPGVIFFTVDSSVENAVKAMKLGALDFIPKNVNLFDQLPEMIQKVFEINKSKQESIEFSKALEKSEKNYKNLVENFPNGIIIQNDNNSYYLNKKACQILGIDNSDEYNNLLIPKLLSAEAKLEFQNQLDHANKNGENPFSEFILHNLNTGNSLKVEFKISAIEFNNRKHIQIIIKDLSLEKKLIQEQNRADSAEKSNQLLQNEISARIKTENDLKNALHEKEILFKELHHRVKNNMQIISSILNLQANTSEIEGVSGLFEESQNRIKSMALIHENIYKTQNIDKVYFPDYVQTLVKNLLQTFELTSNRIEVEYDFDEILLKLDDGIPCGLITNELVSNSFKYAFKNNQKGQLKISCKIVNKNIELKITDNGVGIPDDFDLEEADSLGLQLVSALVDQLEGEVEYNGKNGTTFLIRFPYKNE